MTNISPPCLKTSINSIPNHTCFVKHQIYTLGIYKHVSIIVAIALRNEILPILDKVGDTTL